MEDFVDGVHWLSIRLIGRGQLSRCYLAEDLKNGGKMVAKQV